MANDEAELKRILGALPDPMVCSRCAIGSYGVEMRTLTFQTFEGAHKIPVKVCAQCVEGYAFSNAALNLLKSMIYDTQAKLRAL